MRQLNIIKIFLAVALSAVMASCAKDNYSLPEERFYGSFVDKETGAPIQTAAGTTISAGGIRIRMMEYSWSDTPEPYDFFAKQDGTFNNTKIFKGRYGIIPEGPFVPLDEEIMEISGSVNKVFEVEPLLRVEWVGEPQMLSDGTVQVSVRITRGTTNAEYQQDLAEAWLYVNQIQNVSGNSFSNALSTHLTASDLADYELGDVLTITTGYPNGWSSHETSAPNEFSREYSRPYFLRFAARTTMSFSGINRYNYTEVKEFQVEKN